MAQTKEALAHARSANVPIVVALTKCDKPSSPSHHLVITNVPIVVALTKCDKPVRDLRPSPWCHLVKGVLRGSEGGPEGVLNSTHRHEHHHLITTSPPRLSFQGVDKKQIALVKKQLLEMDLPLEEVGGNVPVVEVSAKTGVGMDELQHQLHLQVLSTALAVLSAVTVLLCPWWSCPLRRGWAWTSSSTSCTCRYCPPHWLFCLLLLQSRSAAGAAGAAVAGGLRRGGGD
eukprot:6193031-Pyramimonas_sp.AAC.1